MRVSIILAGIAQASTEAYCADAYVLPRGITPPPVVHAGHQFGANHHAALPNCLDALASPFYGTTSNEACGEATVCPMCTTKEWWTSDGVPSTNWEQMRANPSQAIYDQQHHIGLVGFLAALSCCYVCYRSNKKRSAVTLAAVAENPAQSVPFEDEDEDETPPAVISLPDPIKKPETQDLVVQKPKPKSNRLSSIVLNNNGPNNCCKKALTAVLAMCVLTGCGGAIYYFFIAGDAEEEEEEEESEGEGEQ